MKKTILIFISMIVIYIIVGNLFSNEVIIPSEAIRIRVIANSNSDYDQHIKKEVKTVLTRDIKNIFDINDNIDTFRNKIGNSIDVFEKNISEVLLKNNYQLPFNINYGLNYFPEKQFKGIKYNEGYYESLVITLGNGLGDNWWCVLFPPLCLIEANEYSDTQYTTLARELIEKYF